MWFYHLTEARWPLKKREETHACMIWAQTHDFSPHVNLTQRDWCHSFIRANPRAQCTAAPPLLSSLRADVMAFRFGWLPLCWQVWWTDGASDPRPVTFYMHATHRRKEISPAGNQRPPGCSISIWTRLVPALILGLCSLNAVKLWVNLRESVPTAQVSEAAACLASLTEVVSGNKAPSD